MLLIHMMQFMILNNWEPADESIRQRTTESETSEYIKHQWLFPMGTYMSIVWIVGQNLKQFSYCIESLKQLNMLPI